MRSSARTTLFAAAAAAVVVLPAAAFATDFDTAARADGPYPEVCAGGDEFARTELFFGLSRPGGQITNGQFERFVDGEVTKRFPDGLTLIKADGQFKDSSGAIIQERARVLILLHAGDAGSSAAIDAIREEYKNRFDQQSVLRTDEQSCVSF